MISQVFGIVAPVLFVVLAGYFYARVKKPNMDSANTLNLDVFVPILILSVFARESIDIAQYGWLIFVATAITLLPGLFTLLIYKPLKVQYKTLALPMMFCNSGNLGIPLMLLTFGEQFLPVILLLFVVENTLHFTVGMWMLSPISRSLTFIKQPMIIATIAGLSLSFLDISLPQWSVVGLGMLGDIAVPLMLFSLGVRLVSLDLSGWRMGVVGAIAAPVMGLFAAALFLPFIDLPPPQREMLILFAALPPAVLNFLLAEKYKQQPDMVASIVMFANAGSIVVIPAVLYFIL